MAKLTRAMTRTALRDGLRASALQLRDDLLEIVLDGTRLLEVGRGDVVVRAREPRHAIFVVIDGLVRLEDVRGTPVAHLRSGDTFCVGDEHERAVAAGPTWLAHLAPDALSAAGQADRAKTVANDTEARARATHAALAPQAGRALSDLARLETGRSLLLLDGDACVRCGVCAAACADTHDGRTRLLRRGPVMSLEGFPSAILPSSCEHCRAPACLPACPTGAIARTEGGIVTLREDLCTGCGSCAKACPWENLALAPRLGLVMRAGEAPSAEPGRSPDVAIKCDLCHGRAEGPACVSACPTQALIRVDGATALDSLRVAFGARAQLDSLRVAFGARAHSEDLAPREQRPVVTSEARELPHERAGAAAPQAAPRRPAGLDLAAAVFVALALTALGRLGPNLRFALGLAAGVGTVVLVAYGATKRAPAVRRRLQQALGSMDAPRQYGLHVLVGLVTFGAALGHSSGDGRASTVAKATLLAFSCASVSGALATFVYRWLPARISRLSRVEWLPEDGRARSRQLRESVLSELSGKSDLVKAVFTRVLDPYRRSPLTFLRLAFQGSTIEGETRRLHAAIERALQGRGKDKLEGVEAVVDAVVSHVAFDVARASLFVLRAWTPVHVASTVVAVLLVLIHAGAELVTR